MPCVFLGYLSNHRGYKCYDLSRNKIIKCRHIMFDESKFPFAQLHTPQDDTYDFLNEGLHPVLHHHFVTSSAPNPIPLDQPTPTHPIPPSPHPSHFPPSPPSQTHSPTRPSTLPALRSPPQPLAH